MRQPETPPRLFRHLVNGSHDAVEDAEQAIVLKPGADPDDPDAFGLGSVAADSGLVIVAEDAPPDAPIGTAWGDIDASSFVNSDGTREDD